MLFLQFRAVKQLLLLLFLQSLALSHLPDHAYGEVSRRFPASRPLAAKSDRQFIMTVLTILWYNYSAMPNVLCHVYDVWSAESDCISVIIPWKKKCDNDAATQFRTRHIAAAKDIHKGVFWMIKHYPKYLVFLIKIEY